MVCRQTMTVQRSVCTYFDVSLKLAADDKTKFTNERNPIGE